MLLKTKMTSKRRESHCAQVADTHIYIPGQYRNANRTLLSYKSYAKEKSCVEPDRYRVCGASPL